MNRSVIRVKSLFHEYAADFSTAITHEMETLMNEHNIHYIVDSNVYELHKNKLAFLEDAPSLILIDAIEDNKDIKTVQQLMATLLESGITKVDVLVAIGGGIIQDITAFTAHTLLRGVHWYFVPTTLLAMCDSCIGSKCGINMGGFKNQLGVFCPPSKALIDMEFLKTLKEIDILSGIGEILKVHMISGKDDFHMVENDYTRLIADPAVLERYVFRSLEIKRGIIEEDEFDTDYRRILNYGHTFGHAMEAYTSGYIPHGIGVTLGMDIANFISIERGLLSEEAFTRISELLRKNIPYDSIDFSDRERMAKILMRDKKYDGQKLKAILCKGIGRIVQERIEINDNLVTCIDSYARSYDRNVTPTVK